MFEENEILGLPQQREAIKSQGTYILRLNIERRNWFKCGGPPTLHSISVDCIFCPSLISGPGKPSCHKHKIIHLRTILLLVSVQCQLASYELFSPILVHQWIGLDLSSQPNPAQFGPFFHLFISRQCPNYTIIIIIDPMTKFSSTQNLIQLSKSNGTKPSQQPGSWCIQI